MAPIGPQGPPSMGPPNSHNTGYRPGQRDPSSANRMIKHGLGCQNQHPNSNPRDRINPRYHNYDRQGGNNNYGFVNNNSQRGGKSSQNSNQQQKTNINANKAMEVTRKYMGDIFSQAKKKND